MSIWKPKKDPLFEVARHKVSALSSAFEKGVKPELEHNKFNKIIPNDPKSPLIMGMGANRHLIYYPENSTPYLHKYETYIKYVEILHGEVIDQITGKKYVQGQKFKIYPGDELKPYTINCDAYIRVCVSTQDTIWERVCK